MHTYQVGLEDVRFYAYHGLFPEERILGNWFVVSVQVIKQVDSNSFAQIDQTFDYGLIYGICKEVMTDPVDLLETVAASISNRLKLTFEGLASYEVHISKEQPPLGMTGGKSRVSLIEHLD
jgi:dihydroneopterin aldolase